MSFSLMAWTETATPGRLMPLWLETGPGTSTTVVTSVSVASVTRTETLPSSMRSTSPGRQSPGRPLNVVETRSFVPTMSSVVIVKVSPTSRMWGPSAKLPRRIFGPCRSTSTATFLPRSSEALRMLA